MIPYLAQPEWRIGAFTVHAFGLLVGVAFVTGFMLVRRRAKAAGIDPDRVGWQYLLAALAGALGGWLWSGGTGVSGTGFALAWTAIVALSAARQGRLWQGLDLFASLAPVCMTIARVGCFLAHDHVGLASDSWLAIRFPSGSRVDLGLLYALAGLFSCAIAWASGRCVVGQPGVLTGIVAASIAAGRLVVLQFSATPAGADAVAAGLMLIAGLAIAALRVTKSS